MAKEKSNDDRKKQYDKKRAGTRTRNYTAIFYPEDLPENWKTMLDETHVKWVESPLHDKDLNADGKPKKAHHHTMFMFQSVKTKEQFIEYLKDLFGESETGSIVGVADPQPVQDKSALIRYFAHLDNPEKVQYDIKDIIGHNGVDVSELFKMSMSETLDRMIEIEEYIETHDITEMCDLAVMVRYEHKDWYRIITTQSTMYFNAFIRSRRHKKQADAILLEYSDVEVNEETGEMTFVEKKKQEVSE